MLVINPPTVTFGPHEWRDVDSVTVDRSASRECVEWGDFGPHLMFADVPEQRIDIRIVRRLGADDLAGPAPGDEGELVFAASPNGSDARRVRIRARAVVVRARHEIGARAGALRVLEFVAVSADGASDPIAVEPAPAAGRGSLV